MKSVAVVTVIAGSLFIKDVSAETAKCTAEQLSSVMSLASNIKFKDCLVATKLDPLSLKISDNKLICSTRGCDGAIAVLRGLTLPDCTALSLNPKEFQTSVLNECGGASSAHSDSTTKTTSEPISTTTSEPISTTTAEPTSTTTAEPNSTPVSTMSTTTSSPIAVITTTEIPVTTSSRTTAKPKTTKPSVDPETSGSQTVQVNSILSVVALGATVVAGLILF